MDGWTYTLLGGDALQALRTERLRALEADHMRATLQLEEIEPTGEPAAALFEHLGDLERRIEHHRGRLPGDVDGERDGSDTPA